MRAAYRICPSISIRLLESGHIGLWWWLEQPEAPGVLLNRAETLEFVTACLGLQRAIKTAKFEIAASLERSRRTSLSEPEAPAIYWQMPGRRRLLYRPAQDQVRVEATGVELLSFPEWELAAIAGGLRAFLDEPVEGDRQ
jgi:hypothetical protein